MNDPKPFDVDAPFDVAGLPAPSVDEARPLIIADLHRREAVILRHCHFLSSRHETLLVDQTQRFNIDQRWLAIAKTHIQEGFMALYRAFDEAGIGMIPKTTDAQEAAIQADANDEQLARATAFRDAVAQREAHPPGRDK